MTVASLHSELALNSYSQLYQISFVGSELGGNVEAIQSVNYFDQLTGSDVSIAVFTDGMETAMERGYASTASVAGNEIGGTFTLTYRGHTTDTIDFNVADTVLKSMIQSLPNIDTVHVVRSGPSVYKEYAWTITYQAMPGDFPDGTGNVLPLIPNYSTLTGVNTQLDLTVAQNGSDPLGGTFSLIMVTPQSVTSLVNVTEIAVGIPADASASELQGYLNALESIGTVSVSRTTLVNGYQWLVTFDGCKIVNGVDVCNEGDVALLRANNSQMQCGASSNVSNSPVSVTQIVKGSGAATDCAGGLCVGLVTDLTGPTPYGFQISSLSAGQPYYVRVAGHNSIGYGYPITTVPESQVPTYNPPGPPPPVRLDRKSVV